MALLAYYKQDTFPMVKSLKTIQSESTAQGARA